MPRYRAIPEVAPPGDTPRASIGGSAILPSGLDIPTCRNCSCELLLFLQFDIDDAWSLPFKTGSHLVVFMCPGCNEIPSFETYEDGTLPASFWEETEGNFFAAMAETRDGEVVLPQQSLLVTQSLRFEPFEQEGHAPDNVLVGGSPYWLQEPERYLCSCGAEMAFVSQIAENFGFEKQSEAPEQPDSFSSDEYCLFLGNEVYIFACPKQCHPRSVWITVQG